MSSREDKLKLVIDYINGRLSPKKKAQVARWISEDPVLQSLVSLIGGIRQETEAIDWEKIKSSAHALLDVQLRQLKSARRKKAPTRGITIFDSKLLPRPEGVRPAAVDTRRLKFKVGEAILEISLYPVSPGSYELIGRLSGKESATDLTVELHEGRKKLSVCANQFGLFRFPRVPIAAYEMIIKDDTDLIARLDIEL